jgi:hypothetical protein
MFFKPVHSFQTFQKSDQRVDPLSQGRVFEYTNLSQIYFSLLTFDNIVCIILSR